MALRALLGFDENVAEEISAGSSVTRTTGRNGVGQALSTNASTTLAALGAGVSTTTIVGFGYQFSVAGSGAIVSLLEGSTTHLTIMGDGSGNVVVRRGIISGTILGTSSGVLMSTANTWYFVEVKATIHDSAGAVSVRINGTQVLNLTAVDTKNVGTTGFIDTVLGNRPGTSGTAFFDDLVILDDTGSAPYNDFIGDNTVITVLPSAAGDSAQWTPSTGTNVAAVDETPPNTTDYVAASTTGLTDLYQLTDLAQITGTVLAVQVQAFCAKSDAGTPPLVKGKLKAGGTGTIQTDTNSVPAAGLSTTYILAGGDIHLTDPDGAAWSIAKVNALQAGVVSA